MNLIKHGKNDEGKYELEFVIEPDLFELGLKNAFHKNANRFNVPGFRKGKAPRNVIERMYGEDIFFDEAINALLPTEYQAALAVANIRPVDNPSFELISASKAEGVAMKASVFVKPEVTLGEYKGLKAVKKVKTDLDQMVDRQLANMQERNARMVEKEGAAENGDIALIDFDGYVDDQPFEGGKAEQFSLTLGSGQFIEGFEEQIVGHVAGDEFDVNVSFPEDYHAQDLAGKPSVFKVKLHELKKKELPEMDDEFAKDVSEFDTLEELKADIMKEAKEEVEKNAELEVENALVEQIIAAMQAEIPEVMYENQITDMVNDFAYRLSQQGLKLDLYLQYSGQDEAALRESFREQAIQQVKIRLALEKIVDLEEINITADEVQEEMKKIADRLGVSEDEITSSVPLSEIRNDLSINKAIDLVRQAAEVTEEEVTDADQETAAQD